MYITNEDLETMIKIEHLLFSSKRTKMFKDLDKNGKCYFNEEEITTEDLARYWNCIERLIITRDKKNKINSQRMAKKRKNNPFYGRSKQEIERIKRKLGVVNNG